MIILIKLTQQQQQKIRFFDVVVAIPFHFNITLFAYQFEKIIYTGSPTQAHTCLSIQMGME